MLITDSVIGDALVAGAVLQPVNECDIPETLVNRLSEERSVLVKPSRPEQRLYPYSLQHCCRAAVFVVFRVLNTMKSLPDF